MRVFATYGYQCRVLSSLTARLSFCSCCFFHNPFTPLKILLTVKKVTPISLFNSGLSSCLLIVLDAWFPWQATGWKVLTNAVVKPRV